MLATCLLALGLTVLCILGLRNDPDPASRDLIIRFVVGGGAVVWAPIVLASVAPRKLLYRALFFALMTALGAVAIGVELFHKLGLPVLPQAPVGAAFGLFVFLAALAPLLRNALRLGVLAPLAATLGAAGGLGYFSLEHMLRAPFSGAATAIALAGGVSVGVGVGADFAQAFARGLTPRAAAAAAGHGAVAPAAFTVLAAAAYAVIVSAHANFGEVDWRVIATGAGAAALAAITALVGATAALAVIRPGEQAAVDENQRRQRFVESWRPFRRLLPATTAFAACAIAGVLVVIAAFEAGVAQLFSLILFVGMIVIASGLAFVSVRTCMLIAVILFISTVFAGYVYAIFGLTPPALSERFAALTLAAMALAQLTVSWRNAGDIWRNARDIAQNAMCDGLRRFAVALGASAASLIVSAYAFEWTAGVAAAGYFVIVAGIGLFMAPMLMVALSTQLQKY